jgi:hypothetical protein
MIKKIIINSKILKINLKNARAHAVGGWAPGGRVWEKSEFYNYIP